MKCFNCLSRFVRKPQTLSKDNCEDKSERMATWDDLEMYGFTMKDMGLKTCPFNPNHRVKATKYSKHVMRCEQQFPKTITLSQNSTSDLNSRFSSVDSFFDPRTEDITDLTKSMNQLNTSDDWFTPEEPQRPSTSTTDSSDRSTSPDSAIGLTNNVNSTEDTTEAEVHASPQTSELTDNRQETERLTDSRTVESQTIPIVPQQVTAVTEPTNGDKGSGDTDDDWDLSSGQTYSLYEGFDNFDELTDDQIMEMANSFIDVVFLTKMTKTQRRKLNEKLIQLKKADKELKKNAFNELVALKDVWDPQINDIPQEIRKPRIDIRELFNFRKKLNKQIDTLKSTTPVSPEPKQCPPNPWSPDRQPLMALTLNGNSTQSSSGCCTASAPELEVHRHEVNTVCNSCRESLLLTEENIKRMTVFCAKCSGIKFGGYFECHSCQLYGYFANNQISQHLSKHFHQ